MRHVALRSRELGLRFVEGDDGKGGGEESTYMRYVLHRHSLISSLSLLQRRQLFSV